MSNGADKVRYLLAEAEAAARELVNLISLACQRIVIAGSIRRRKPTVGDIELLFVPAYGRARLKDSLFYTEQADLAEAKIAELLAKGVLAKRPNKNGNFAWGGKIKLAVHGASGIPVDLFTATHANWFNYLVCRTGPASSNMAICNAAIAKGWKWEPYSDGFVVARDSVNYGQRHVVASERDVFEFVGLPYREPEDRQ